MSKESVYHIKNKPSKTVAEKSAAWFESQILPLALGLPPEIAKIQVQKSVSPIGYWQAVEQVFQKKGIVGFWSGGHYVFLKKGINAVIIGFSITEIAKYLAPFYDPKTLEKYPDAPYLAAAPVAAAISASVSNCFDRLRIFSTTSDARFAGVNLIKKSYSDGGVKQIFKTLYQGYPVTCGSKLWNLWAFHGANPILRGAASCLKGESLTSEEANIVGGVTGIVVSSLSTPLSRIFTEVASKPSSINNTVREALSNVIKSSGVKGLFAGGAVHCIHGGLSGYAYTKTLSKVDAIGYAKERPVKSLSSSENWVSSLQKNSLNLSDPFSETAILPPK